MMALWDALLPVFRVAVCGARVEPIGGRMEQGDGARLKRPNRVGKGRFRARDAREHELRATYSPPVGCMVVEAAR